MEWIPALISLFSAAIAVSALLRHLSHTYTWENRVQAVEDRNKTLAGRVYQDEKSSREEIREAVDQYLAQRDGSAASGGELEMMMQMMQLMGGGLGAPQRPEPEQPEQSRKPAGLVGRGGQIASNGEES